MNKNKIFAKFVFLYVGNINDIKDIFFDIWDSIKILLKQIWIIMSRIVLIFLKILLIFFPVLQIWAIQRMIYLTNEDLIKLDSRAENTDGYYIKESIDIYKKKLMEYEERYEGSSMNKLREGK
jgi:hypothetical protein